MEASADPSASLFNAGMKRMLCLHCYLGFSGNSKLLWTLAYPKATIMKLWLWATLNIGWCLKGIKAATTWIWKKLLCKTEASSVDEPVVYNVNVRCSEELKLPVVILQANIKCFLLSSSIKTSSVRKWGAVAFGFAISFFFWFSSKPYPIHE